MIAISILFRKIAIISIIGSISILLFSILYKKGILKMKREIWIFTLGILYMTALLIVTLLSRSYGEVNRSYLYDGIIAPGKSYEEAYLRVNVVCWMNIYLNVLLFVPFGVLLPLCTKNKAKSWMVYLSGVILTFFIETVQYLGKAAPFEFDDCINNSIGAFIGYGLYRLILRKRNRNRVFIYQLPIIVYVIGNIVFLVFYLTKPYGNIDFFYKKYDRRVSVSLSAELSDESVSAKIYKDSDSIFKLISVGNKINGNNRGLYNLPDTSFEYWYIYSGSACLGNVGIKNRDLRMNNIVLSSNEKNLYELSEEDTYKFLYSKGIELPDNLDFYIENHGSDYVICYTAGENNFADIGIMGGVTLRQTKGSRVYGIEYTLHKLVKYSDIELQSIYSAVQKIREGEFSGGYIENETIESIDIIGADVIYTFDSKGIYRPYYAYNVIINEIATWIYVEPDELVIVDK